ncbi:MAG: hypothetical protein EBZ48_02400 [Proteobacteria bacterium]|nr:hypothetical protein [Pseudomonadota bacterium]
MFDKRNTIRPPHAQPLPGAPESTRFDTSQALERHKELPPTVVDRTSFLTMIKHAEGLFGVIDHTSLLDLPDARKSAVALEALTETLAAVEALHRCSSQRGKDLPTRAVGFSVTTFEGDESALELISTRAQVHRLGLASLGASIQLDLDGDQTAQLLASKRCALLAVYDLSELTRVPKAGKNDLFTAKDAGNFSKAFLGEITLFEGGQSALALALLRDSPAVQISDSARIYLAERLPVMTQKCRADTETLKKSPGFEKIQRLLESRLQVLERIAHDLETSGTIRSIVYPTLQEHLASIHRDQDLPPEPFKPGWIYGSKEHPGIPNTVAGIVWDGFPKGADTEAIVQGRHWLVERFAADIASLNPLQALANLVTTAYHYQHKLGLAASRWADLPVYQVNSQDLQSSEAVATVSKDMALHGEAQPAGEDKKGTLRAAIPLIRDSQHLRPCDLSNPYESQLATDAAFVFLEELIHLEQAALQNAQRPGGASLLSNLTSLLAKRYFDSHPEFAGTYREKSTDYLTHAVDEIDAVARLTELVHAHGLPLTQMHTELFDYHLDKRWHFVRWLVQTGVIPRSLAPDYLFDDSKLRAKLVEE